MKRLVQPIVFVSVFLLSMVCGAEEGNVFIKINSDSHVNARTYFLKDIAQVKAPGMMKQELENFSLGFSPAIGEVRRVSGERLASKIKSIAWLSQSAEIIFPDSVFIKRVGQEIPEQRLKKIYHDHIVQGINNQAFEIRDFKVRGLDLYPLGKVDLSMISRSDRDVKGRVSIYVDVRVDGISHGRVSVSGYVDVYDTVVCATRRLSRGAILKPGDLCLRRINISNVPDNYLTSMDLLPGMRLKQNLSSEGYFRASMLEKPPLVERGDNVILVARKGNMRIVATGIADQEGGLGDRIQVNNLTTRRMVSGTISGPKTVDVFF